MKNKNRPKREKKKPAGVFAEKKRRNRRWRKYTIALLIHGKEWADKMVGEYKEGK